MSLSGGFDIGGRATMEASSPRDPPEDGEDQQREQIRRVVLRSPLQAGAHHGPYVQDTAGKSVRSYH